jgi:hypothetical protein
VRGVEGKVITLDEVSDGGSYTLPEGLSSEQTNLFFTVARLGSLFVKIPTERGLGDYRTFIRDGQVTDADIRPLEDAERFEALDRGLHNHAALRPVARPGSRGQDSREHAHYLLVHWLQYDRLRTSGLIGIPESRFALVARPGSGGRATRDQEIPANFQERIPGATLWDMFDFESESVRPAWKPFKATIATQLSALLDSALVNHIDWNIKNFVFHGAEQRLYYVDSKPSLYVARSSNDQNLSGIRTHFLA